MERWGDAGWAHQVAGHFVLGGSTPSRGPLLVMVTTGMSSSLRSSISSTQHPEWCRLLSYEQHHHHPQFPGGDRVELSLLDLNRDFDGGRCLSMTGNP